MTNRAHIPYLMICIVNFLLHYVSIQGATLRMDNSKGHVSHHIAVPTSLTRPIPLFWRGASWSRSMGIKCGVRRYR